MFFYLSKLAPAFLFPPGLTIVLLVGAAFLRRRRPTLAGAVVFIALASTWALSTHFVAETFLRSLESRYPTILPADAPQADAIVVLGGYLHSPGGTHAFSELNESGDRLWMGAQLFRAAKAPLVLLTGGNVPMFRGHSVSEALAAKDLLQAWGVPGAAILVETESRNTRENATLSSPILAGKGARRLLLVTSAFHMPRAVAIFRRAGMDVTPVPTDYQSGWDDGDLPFRVLPDAESMYKSNLALREWLGLSVYRLRGWA